MEKGQPNKAAKALLPRVIAIGSGKGGVGKSSITVNLGILLAKTGAKVCLLDADTGLANANILLGLTPQFSLEHVLYGAKPIEDVMLDGPHGLKVIPGAHGISECVSLHPRQQLRLTRELARIENDFDYILVDTAAGITDTTLDFISAAQHTVVVITPEPTSLTDAFSLIKLLKRRRNSIRYHVVVNMCSNAGQAKEVFHRFCAAVGKYIGVKLHFLGCILRDESMRAAVVLQNPVAMFPDTDPSCKSFVKLVDSLEAATSDVPVRKSFSAYWHRQFREQQNQPAGNKAVVQPVADPAPEQTRDADYLAELRTRLLLLIEQGPVEETQLAATLRDSFDVFVRRFERSPVELLPLIEQLILSPERNDQVLRDIAERIQPWSGNSRPPPTAEMAPSEVDPPPLVEDMVHVAVGESEDVNSAQPEPWANPPVEMPVALPSTAAVGRFLHHYDATRFGSQENLLDMLKRRRSDEQTLAEFLAALA